MRPANGINARKDKSILESAPVISEQNECLTIVMRDLYYCAPNQRTN